MPFALGVGLEPTTHGSNLLIYPRVISIYYTANIRIKISMSIACSYVSTNELAMMLSDAAFSNDT